MASAARRPEGFVRSSRREGAQTRDAPSGLEVPFWEVSRRAARMSAVWSRPDNSDVTERSRHWYGSETSNKPHFKLMASPAGAFKEKIEPNERRFRPQSG